MRNEVGVNGAVLVADDDGASCHGLVTRLQRAGWKALGVQRCEELFTSLALLRVNTVIIEPNLEGRWYGLLLEVRRAAPNARLIVATAYASEAMRRVAALPEVGAAAFFEKPVYPERVEGMLRAARSGLQASNTPDKAAMSDAARGWSDAMIASLARVEWEHINRVFADCAGRVTETAQILRIPRQTLYRKLRQHAPRE